MSERISVYVVDLSTASNPRRFLYFQWVDPTTGKRRTQSSKCKTRREAERSAKAFEDRLNAKLPTGDGSIRWEDFVTVYTEEHLLSLDVSSQRRVLSAFSMISKIISPDHLSSITTAALSKYAQTLRGDPWNRSETTIQLHLSKLSTALRWGVERGYLATVPAMPRIARSKGTKAKGRPITDREFLTLLRAVSQVVGRVAARSWRRLLVGLWLSGLRLDEALHLTWKVEDSHEADLWIDLSGKYPLLGIAAESEKGRQDRLLPLTPDFGKWLCKTPQHMRTGPVFPLVKHRHKGVIRLDHVSKTICQIGEASGVVVSSTGKFCSAHDLRRTFGLRWSQKLMPAELQQLMRHEDIATTMKFYALVEATSFAERLWNRDKDTTLSTTPDAEK